LFSAVALQVTFPNTAIDGI